MLLNMDALGWEEGRYDLLMVNSVLLLGKPVIAVMESMLSFVLFILFLKVGIWAYSILANAPANSSSGWIGLGWTGGLGCLLYGSLLSVLHIKLTVGI